MPLLGTQCCFADEDINLNALLSPGKPLDTGKRPQRKCLCLALSVALLTVTPHCVLRFLQASPWTLESASGASPSGWQALWLVLAAVSCLRLAQQLRRR